MPKIIQIEKCRSSYS